MRSRWDKIVFVLLSGFILLETGCLKDISSELPNVEPKITVNSFITPNTAVIAFITRSRSTIENVENDYLNDAKAYIYENDMLVDSLTGFSQYHYSSLQYLVSAGKNYRIDVSAPGFKSVSASTSIPNDVPIQSVQLDTVFYAPSGHNTYVLRIKLIDPAATTDYYHLMVSRNRLDKTGQWGIDPLCYETDDLMFESLSKNQCIGGTFSDATFNGLEKEIVINTKRRLNSKLNDSVQFIVELRHGTEEYYRYKKTFINFKNNQWDIFAQPASIYGNIENGYGIFGGYAPSIDTVKLN